MRKELAPRRVLAALIAALTGSAAIMSVGAVPGATEASAAPQARFCESLLSLHLPKTLMTAAQSIPAGDYLPSGSTTTLHGLPAFCRVTATISPEPGSSIGIEVWLPTTAWNGKYQQSGNHGFGGIYYWGEMVGQSDVATLRVLPTWGIPRRGATASM